MRRQCCRHFFSTTHPQSTVEMSHVVDNCDAFFMRSAGYDRCGTHDKKTRKPTPFARETFGENHSPAQSFVHICPQLFSTCRRTALASVAERVTRFSTAVHICYQHT